MSSSFKDSLASGPVQLNIIGVFLLIILVISAWFAAHPLTLWSVMPLACMGYAAFSIVFELTINRANVPTLATGFIGRGKIAKILKHEATQHGDGAYTIIDLGSGRGQLTRHIAKAIPNARVIGIEMARIPCRQAALIQHWLGPKNLSYQCCDFWPYDCSQIDAVVFFLTPTIAQRVGEKLHRELKSGSTVISHSFPLLGTWTPIDVLHFRTPFKEVIYVYRKS